MDAPSPSREPVLDLVIVVPSFNQRSRLAACLDSVAEELRRTDLVACTVVVDNASWDGSAELVARAYPAVSLLENEVNQGFSVACNQGGRLHPARYVLVLNNDAQLEAGSLQALVEMADTRPRLAAVTGRLLAPDRRERFPVSHVWQRWLPPPRRPVTLSWVPGTATLFRREALDAVGWFDEDFFFYHEDLDLSWRLRRAGWELWYTPAARIRHHEGGSSALIRDRLVVEAYRGAMLLAGKHHGRMGYLVTRALLRFDVRMRLAALRLRRRWCEPNQAMAARLLVLEAAREVLRLGLAPRHPVGVAASPEA
ncbi:MAG: glycosyltransferase family 2 protein [Candidatus Sericytochromatia bacterium]|nr:glycosyltransferase family 2 protein [Candidatus Sericytochromatia bacterium]